MGNLFPEYGDSVGTHTSGAIFSDCRKYRYALWRTWDENKPILSVIGLNPSTANETSDDPTIRRVKAIAKHHGYGGITMLNLFGIISADPKVLQTAADPIGDNDRWLKHYANGDVVCAWGNFKEAEQRSKEVLAMLEKPLCLHINKNGTPKHPLYCKTESPLKNFLAQ